MRMAWGPGGRRPEGPSPSVPWTGRRGGAAEPIGRRAAAGTRTLGAGSASAVTDAVPSAWPARGPRRRSPALGVTVALLACCTVAATGCGRSHPGGQPTSGGSAAACNLPLCGAAAKIYVEMANSQYGQYLGMLGALSTAMVVYLPTWTPPLPPDECFSSTGSSGADSYSIELWMAPCSGAGPSGPPAFPPPENVYAWLITGGQAGTSGSAPVVTPSGAPTRRVSLGSGITASYYPGTADTPTPVLQWHDGAWTYEVTDPGSVETGDGALVSAARSLWSQVRRETTPVPSEESGTVVEQIGGAGNPIWVAWGSVDAAYYTVAGPDTSALEMANSMVRVQFPA